ncbi:MAG TPA: hypothetical protein VGK50_08545 [Coriobacteriia bacterium]|jgi:hypothetical protein
MKLLARGLVVTLVLAVAVGACARETARTGRPAEKPMTAAKQAASQIAEGHALLAQGSYDRAMDVFVTAAAYGEATTDAVTGAVAALDGKAAGHRLRDRLDAALALQKRLPTTARRDALRAKVQDYLLGTVVQQVKQAEALLADRRRFVAAMRDSGEGDVRSATADGRVLTEAEAVEAQTRLRDLTMPYAMMDLYIRQEALAAALDRFASDDQEYLQQDTVSDRALDSIERSCDDLADALPPVQRRLDRMKPDWRKG